MDFNPRVTVDSTVASGVRFTLKRISPARRAMFEASIAEHSAKLRDLLRKSGPLRDEYAKARKLAEDAAEPEIKRLVAEGMPRAEAEARVPVDVDFPQEKLAELGAALADEARFQRDVIAAETVRALFVSIEGFTIEGAVPTLEQLREDGLPALWDEIADAAAECMSLTAAQQKNLLSPGISAPAEDGQATPTTATLADAANSGNGETALDTSHNMLAAA